LSVFGFVPATATALPVTLILPTVFLPFDLTFTGTSASTNALHAEPVSADGVFRVKVAGWDLNLRVLRPLGGVQPDRPGWLMHRRALKAQTLLQAPSVSQVGSPSVHSRTFGLVAAFVPSVSRTT
jgi:hypothetical protein